jgi:hypothetical protein
VIALGLARAFLAASLGGLSAALRSKIIGELGRIPRVDGKFIPVFAKVGKKIALSQWVKVAVGLGLILAISPAVSLREQVFPVR